ncbi:hypothetical protein WJX73_004295 [Symbiochloris irregularis]|uniref:non-specific serine/threonine protein kinase n=1 Tax=Symbiochloris irregularis TaxID=706552 RepID=A0AAW1P465_9CHLO
MSEAPGSPASDQIGPFLRPKSGRPRRLALSAPVSEEARAATRALLAKAFLDKASAFVDPTYQRDLVDDEYQESNGTSIPSYSAGRLEQLERDGSTSSLGESNLSKTSSFFDCASVRASHTSQRAGSLDLEGASVPSTPKGVHSREPSLGGAALVLPGCATSITRTRSLAGQQALAAQLEEEVVEEAAALAETMPPEGASSCADGNDADLSTLAGWQAIAAQIMEDGEAEAEQAVAEAAASSAAADLSDLNTLAGWQAIAAQMIQDGEEEGESGTTLAVTCRPRNVEERQQSSQTTPSMALEEFEADGPGMSFVPAASQSLSAKAALMSNQSSVQVHAAGNFHVIYRVEEKLGEGAFGAAFKVKRRKDGEMFVVKRMNEQCGNQQKQEEARNEVQMLAGLKHINIVRYYESFVDEKDRLLIIMELCEEGDLDTWVKAQRGRHLTEDEVMVKFVQICLGLLHVHSQGIIHRDIKANNIFVNSSGMLKLGDFGISKQSALPDGPALNRALSMVGTPYYMSPEMFKGRKYDQKTDVWAIGCMLFELCALRKAFDGRNQATIMLKVMSGYKDSISDHYSSELQQLVKALLETDPVRRPSVAEVLQLDFVRMHLQAYHDCMIGHVALTRRRSFVSSLAPHLPALATEALSVATEPELPFSTRVRSSVEPCTPGGSSRNSLDETANRLRREASAAALTLQRSQEFADAKVKLSAFKASEREKRKGKYRSNDGDLRSQGFVDMEALSLVHSSSVPAGTTLQRGGSGCIAEVASTLSSRIRRVSRAAKGSDLPVAPAPAAGASSPEGFEQSWAYTPFSLRPAPVPTAVAGVLQDLKSTLQQPSRHLPSD